MAIAAVVSSTGCTSGNNTTDDGSRRGAGEAPQPAVTATGSTPSPSAPPSRSPSDPVLVGAGDIASSGSGDAATAALLDDIKGTVFTLGDNAYDSGTSAEFATHYGPTWGRHRARTRPSAGNHDYGTGGAAGYYGYFGARAGEAAKGYYSYDLGDWHVVVINSNVARGPGSPQLRWLRADLAARARPCTLAYWHHPRFTSGADHPPDTSMGAVWRVLYDFNADVVLSGHNHQYERFAPQDPAGRGDPARGIRQFVAGTGGAGHYGFGAVQPNSDVRNGDTYGVLKLTLHSDSYDWHFVPVAGKTFTDRGTGSCH